MTLPPPDDAPGRAPAFQWFPGDHRRDTAVQLCSFEARALWREMLDLMHFGDPYGHLAAGGAPITPAELARVAGIPAAKAKRLLDELEVRKVFSRTPAGVIFSRRMVKDEHLRTVRRLAGAKGGRNTASGNADARSFAQANHEANRQHGVEQTVPPAVAVAVSSLRSASATTPNSEGRGVSELVEAGRLLAQLKRLSTEFVIPGHGVQRTIPRDAVVSTLGAYVWEALEGIGGPQRVLATKPELWGIVTRDFAAQLRYPGHAQR